MADNTTTQNNNTKITAGWTGRKEEKEVVGLLQLQLARKPARYHLQCYVMAAQI